MKKVFTILLLLLSFLGFSQNPYQMASKSVPTFFGSDTKSNKEKKLEDITIRTLKHIEIKTDSVFLRRLGLKENDSISFNVAYLISSDGTTPMDSVQIDTGVRTLDNYMKLMINSLPKFVPAFNSETSQSIDYKINMEAKFTVKDRKLKAIYTEKQKVKNFIPILASCQNEKSDYDKRNCTYKEINQNVISVISNFRISEGLSQIKILVRLSINEYGKIDDVKILRTDFAEAEFQDKLIKGFYGLTNFVALESNFDESPKGIYTLPITIQIGGGQSNYRQAPINNSNRYQNSRVPNNTIYNPQSNDNRDRNNYLKQRPFSY